MKTVKLGNQGLEVPQLGLGCMGMSDFYGQSDDQASLQTLKYALSIGENFWDTADMYGPHTNELLLGRAIRESGISRDELILATKFGVVREDDPTARPINGRPEYVRAACEASLKRLGVDHIDLYYQHRVDVTVPIEETVGAMAELVAEGKVRYLGLSEAGVETLKRASSVHPISALQNEYSLWSRELDEEILPACQELGIGLVAYSPLGRGFLTGAIQKRSDLEKGDWRLVNPRFLEENFDDNLKIVERLQTLASDKQCTPAQLSLAWLMQQEATIIPIPGTRSQARLSENVAACDVQLSAQECQLISQSIPEDWVKGGRYPDAAKPLLNV
jgi:aryl-alcohol dehydrogenase-like predicted oxidoreductase